MIKKLKGCFFFFILLISISIFAPKQNVYGLEEIQVNFIVDNVKYKKGDYIYLTINISDCERLKEIKIGLNKTKDFEDHIEFFGSFEINESYGISNILVNEVVEEGFRLHIQKNNMTNQHQLGTLKLLCIKDIENIITYLEENVTVYLFNNDNKLMDVRFLFSEKLKATWNILINEIEVFSSVPDYIKSFNVVNRKEDEYEIILKQNIDSKIVGTQVVSVIVIDKINGEYLLFTEPIHVVDKVVPTLNYPQNICLKDIDINTFDLNTLIKINDNYDDNAKIVISYYNDKREIITSFDLFKEYLKHHQLGYISFYGIDSSDNKTGEVELEISTEDTTPPVVTKIFQDDIIIKDYDLDNVSLNSFFLISDEYDLNPTLYLNTYSLNSHQKIDDYKKVLLENKKICLEYYASDEFGNFSEIQKVNIVIDDTGAPVIEGVKDISIDDVLITSNFFVEGIKVSDNIDNNPKLIITYYINEEEVSKYLFLEKIKKGFVGWITYQASDESNNQSEIYLQKISVTDTTPPVIEIFNIKEGGKYLKVDLLDYKISDNFNGDVEVYIEHNSQKYNGTDITNIGEHNITIFAKDASGNESKKQIKFTIIENNIKGCCGDIKCYVDNYSSVIVTVTVLTICSIALVIIKIILERKKAKPKLREIKNDNIE